MKISTNESRYALRCLTIVGFIVTQTTYVYVLRGTEGFYRGLLLLNFIFAILYFCNEHFVPKHRYLLYNDRVEYWISKKLHKVIYFDKYQFTYFPTLNIRNKDTGMHLRLKYVPLGGRTERVIANWIKSKSTE